MKMPVLAFFFAVILLQTSIAEEISKVNSARIVKDFNSNWSFNYFPSEKPGSDCELPAFDDSKWKAVSLPHTWNTYETTGLTRAETDLSGDNYWNTGWGWYRKHFRTGPEITGKKVFLEFDGVQGNCKVWLNGKLLGEHSGGYGRFDFDITSFLRRDGDNVIAVSVRNKVQGASYNLYGGIHRNVNIVIRNPLYIPMQGSALHEGGTAISSFDVSQAQGSVSIQTWVKNDNPSTKVCILQTTIKDKSGKIVQSLKSTAEIKSGDIYRFSQVSKAIKDPHLWSPGAPYLYSVVSEINEGKSLADNYESTFGFRWVEQKPEGLYLNGEKITTRQWIVPRDYPFLGSIIPEELFNQILKDVKSEGRERLLIAADYPLQAYVYDLADRNGILSIVSVPAGSSENQDPGVSREQIYDVIRSERNHPSILFWKQEDGSINDSYNIIRSEDPGRPVISGNEMQSLISQKANVAAVSVQPDAASKRAVRIELKTINDRIAGRGSIVKI
jgi:beta-galactosidase/beta-glucuronidase